MSYIQNDAAEFAAESAAGFVAAHSATVRRVPGGVARRAATRPDEVAVVIGGGSGHYPAFAGLVGAGLAHAAAMGNVFASPSAQEVYSVAKSVATPAGVLLSYGNYTGDVLNFNVAQDRLRAEGIPCETVAVTDDVSSAGRNETHKRRGIAGDLVVFRAAAWAAEQGRDLAGVAALAAHANARTRSLGVAFTGCTLPGASEPLFTVPAGQMAVGMGIHGEPGMEAQPIPSASELARICVSELLAEAPAGAGGRVGVVVNGLGSVKGEELYLLYNEVAPLLERAGLEIVEPEVGEFATSFDMAGISVTVVWLDTELEAAWRSPAATPAYRKGTVAEAGQDAASDNGAAESKGVPEATAESVAAAASVRDVLHAIRDVIDEQADELGRLDAIAGDGDHGIGMQRGSRAGAAVEATGAGAGTALALAGDAWALRAGGTSGALWGAGLRAAGTRIGDARAPQGRDVADAVSAFRAAVQQAGKAEPGDKTLVDALVPFDDELRRRIEAGEGLVGAWRGAAEAATSAAAATAELVPKLGRARPHAHKSVGTPDPGAVSFAAAATAAVSALAACDQGSDRREQNDD